MKDRSCARTGARSTTTRARGVLTGDAELQRDGEHFAAGKIRYWPESGRVEGRRGEDGERVQIRIEPDAGNGDGGDSP